MIHIMIEDGHFSIPANKFSLDKPYKSFSYLGGPKVGNYVAPSGCNAIDNNKTKVLLKSFSESLERRSLMAGGHSEDGYHVVTYDLISNEISKLPLCLTQYNNFTDNFIDTTGTAAHYCGKTALNKALTELFEKNALFLFWYGKLGKCLSEDLYENIPVYKKIRHARLETKLFLNKSFDPLKVIITFIYKDDFIYSSGVGSSLNVFDAISHSLNEAFLLMWENNFKENMYNIPDRNIEKNYHKQCLNHITSIENATDIISSISTKDLISSERILDCVPAWVTELHVINLKNTLFPKIKCVKIYSPDLNNHIPQRARININTKINRMTLQMSETHLDQLPDCIVV